MKKKKDKLKKDELKIAKALGASRVIREVRVEFPGLARVLKDLENQHTFEAEAVRRVMQEIEMIWLKEIMRPSRNEQQRIRRLSFAELIHPVLKRGMSNAVFMEALRNYYGKKTKRKNQRRVS